MFQVKPFLVAVAFGLIAIVLFSTVKTFLTGRAAFIVRTDQSAVVKEMRSLNRLETAQFTIEKVIEAGTNENEFKQILFGDKILLIAHGDVVAGFDLAVFSEKQVEVKGRTVTVILPAPQILYTKLDNDKTRVYDRRQGLLTKGNKDLETKARQAAESEIQKAACGSNILNQAGVNGRKQLTTLFTGLGFTSVTIIVPEVSC